MKGLKSLSQALVSSHRKGFLAGLSLLCASSVSPSDVLHQNMG